MATSIGRSPLLAYLAMAGVAASVFVGLNVISDPAPRSRPPRPTPSLPTPADPRAPAIERDFLTTVLGRPKLSRAQRYCNGQGCCPTWRTTFGTTAPTREVIEAFEVQGYVSTPSDPDADVARGGPFPFVRWSGDLDYGGRWRWRRAQVSRGADVDRPAWPTVFTQSSVACGEA